MHTALFRAFSGGTATSSGTWRCCSPSAGRVDREGGLRAALGEGRCVGKVIPGGRLAARLGVDPVPTMFVAPGGAPLEEGRITGARPHGGRVEAVVEGALGRLWG